MTIDDYKSLILLRQQEIPTDGIPRTVELPLNSNKIVTVTGVRRCGKSTLMNLAINELLASGVKREQILWIGFDDERLVSLKSEQLNDIITAYMELYPSIPIKEAYIFFDEIQLVDGWEYFVIRLFKSYCKNIFISGSNSKMLSSQLNTVLRGWPIEQPVTPLSFKEYCVFKKIDTTSFLEQDLAVIQNAFNEYCFEGGFPEAVLADTKTAKTEILQRYFNLMLFRDMMEHFEIKSSTEIVKYFMKRIMLNLSKPTAINNIYNDVKSQGRTISKDTLYQWAEYACDIFLFDKVRKYSTSIIKSNNSLPKYYIVDNGLRNAIIMPQSDDRGKLFENAVYHHLKRNLNPGEIITYYKSATAECDFVIQTDTQASRIIQATWTMKDSETTRRREIQGLMEAAKNTGCSNLLIVTSDEEGTLEENGTIIQVVKASKWMLH